MFVCIECSHSRSMIDRDERRWKKADFDSDGQLTKVEFQSFLHPEDHPNMVDIVVLETLEDMDKDNDGAINEQEYIGDIYKVNTDLISFVLFLICLRTQG